MLRAALLAVLLVAMAPPEAIASCNDLAEGRRAPPFEFILSKPDQVRSEDLGLDRADRGLELRSRVSKGTPVEKRGRKRSQRSEVRETEASSRITLDGGWTCYAFEFRVSEDTTLPRSGRRRAKLSIAQFHQEPVGRKGLAPSGLFLEVTPKGGLELIFSDHVGARSKIIAGSKEGILGRWWRIEIAARWSTGGSGRTVVWLAPVGKTPTLRLDDRGPNTTTGHVYQKLGAYRSFIERDRRFARNQVKVRYRRITRNGVEATFRQE